MGSIPIPGTNLEPTARFEKYLREVKRLVSTTFHDKVRRARSVILVAGYLIPICSP